MSTRVTGLAVVVVAMLCFLFIPSKTVVVNEIEQKDTTQVSHLNSDIRGYLESKQSPLAPETDFLLEQKHWKLLIAVSAIESQYCKRQLGNNCWGVGGDSAYRHYSSIKAAIQDANDLIERWQLKGRWLTVEDMNCSYVVPCNSNWVNVVNKVLKEMDAYEQQSTGTIHQQK